MQAAGPSTITGSDGTFSLPGVSGTNVVVVAARKGYFNGSVTVTSTPSTVMIALRPVPQDDDPSYVLVSPEACGGCPRTSMRSG